MESPSTLARDYMDRCSGLFTHYNKCPGTSLTYENEWISRNPVPGAEDETADTTLRVVN